MYRTILTSLLFTACAIESPESTIDDGKSDSIAGKGLRIRPTGELFMWNAIEHSADKPEVFEDETKIVLTTDQTVVAEGWLLVVEGSTNEAFDQSPWAGDRIGRMRIEPGATGEAIPKFMVLVPSGMGGASIMSCTGATGTTTVFTTLAIDLNAREVHADDNTFTAMQCGLGGPNAEGVSTFLAFPVAFDNEQPDKPLIGTHKYKFTVDVL